jgi:hypothetical protein
MSMTTEQQQEGIRSCPVLQMSWQLSMVDPIQLLPTNYDLLASLRYRPALNLNGSKNQSTHAQFTPSHKRLGTADMTANCLLQKYRPTLGELSQSEGKAIDGGGSRVCVR